MARVIDIKTRKTVLTKTPVTRDDFWDLVEATKEVVRELQGVNMKQTLNLLAEMKWNAAYNQEFRNKTYLELEDLFYLLHERTQK
jgi:hypothetical protein